jgi:glycosyltransferase involved in cell wall biosynthesis
MSKKILILTNFGMGLYKFRKELLLELIKSGNEVIVSFPYDEYVDKITSLGCKYIETKVDRRGTNILFDASLFISYIRIIGINKPDIVLTYTVKPNIYGGIASSLLHRPFIPNVTGLGTSLESESLLQKLILYLYKMSFKKAKSVFFQNASNEEFFKKHNIVRNNSILIPGSGVNTEEFEFKDYPISNKYIRFTFIGRIMKAKGIEEFLKAAEIVKKRVSNTEFHVVGYCEENYQEMLYQYQENKIISYHGQIDDVKSVINQSHVIVLPSYHEGLSNVLLESAASGRPIIASNIPGCKETFDEGISGFGFEEKNINSLASCMEKFVLLPHYEKIKMGYYGRKKIEKEFDRTIILSAYMKEINKGGEI